MRALQAAVVCIAWALVATEARAAVVTGELGGDPSVFSSPALRAQEAAVTIVSRSAAPGGASDGDAGAGARGKGLLLGRGIVLTSIETVAVRGPSGEPVPLDDIEIAGPHVAADGRATLLVLIDGADLALLRVETDAGPSAARFGDSTSLEVGDLVFSPSDPSVHDSLATGVVVGEIRRQLANATLRYLETTLPVAAAPPGAPVFDAHGDVVGLAAAAHSPDGSPLVLRIEDVKRVLLPLAGDR